MTSLFSYSFVFCYHGCFIIFVLFSAHLIAEEKLAIINDLDGFTNIRAGKGTNFEIVGKIKSGDFFYCEKNSDEWYFVRALQWYEKFEGDDYQVKGYIHKSRIRIIEEMDFEEQKKIITNILKNYMNLNLTVDKYLKSNSVHEFNLDPIYDSISNKLLGYDSRACFEYKFEPILGYFSDYFCKYKDTATLHLMFNSICSQPGSANEAPGYILAECYICDENLFLKTLKKIKKREELKILICRMSFGLENVLFHNSQEETYEDKNYKRLVNKLEKLLKK